MTDSPKKTIIDQAAELAEAILPQLESAAGAVKEKAGPVIAEAKEKAAPIIAEGRSIAQEKAGQAAEMAASLKEEVKQERSGGSGVKRLLVIGALVALGAVLYRKVRTRADEEEDWESAYSPAPPAAPAAPAPPAPPADAAAASPDEALADAVEEPHEVTTPDEPAEVVDVEVPEESEAAPKDKKG